MVRLLLASALLVLSAPVFMMALGSNIKSPSTSPLILAVNIVVFGPKTLELDWRRLAIFAVVCASPLVAATALGFAHTPASPVFAWEFMVFPIPSVLLFVPLIV